MTPKRIAIVAGGVVLLGALSWNVYKGPLWNRDSRNEIPPSIVTGTPNGEEAKMVSPGIEYRYTTPASTTPQKEVKPRADIPSLNRLIVIPASFSPADASLIKEDIGKLIDAIKKSPENGALWATLGMKRKGIEDYEGAKEAYEYALKLMPNNAVVADSLGVIYGDYLKDYPKAEQHFRLALTLDPTASYLYMRLFEFYRYRVKDAGKAKAILEEGLRAIPGNSSLKTLLETM